MIRVRTAKKADAPEVAQLISLAMEDLSEAYTGKKDQKEAEAVLTRFVEDETCRFSYHRVIVAEVDGKIAGAIVYYPADKLDEMDGPILALLHQTNPDAVLPVECRGHELYLDSLAVFPAFRGMGVADKLLGFFADRAGGTEYHRQSLLVDEKKPGVIKLYQKHGFRHEDIFEIHGHCYHRMIRFVD